MQTIRRLVQLSLCLTLVLMSCKKYPENNLFLRNPYNVISGEWKLKSYIVDGTDSTNFSDISFYTSGVFDFGRGETQGTFGAKDLTGPLYLNNTPNSINGNWSLDQKKHNINLWLDNPYSVFITQNFGQQKYILRQGTYRIEKLNRKEFHISRTINNIKYDYRFNIKR